MTLRVPYIADDAIERDAEGLIAEYAHAKGIEIRAPIPIEDIVETHLKLRVEFDDLHRLLDVPRSGIGLDPDIFGAIWLESGKIVIAEGDVGLAKITPCFENGKTAVFRNLTGGLGSGTTELHIVRPLFVDPDYILLFLKSPHFIETGIPKMTGTAGQKRVPTEYFGHSPFTSPTARRTAPHRRQGRCADGALRPAGNKPRRRRRNPPPPA